MNKKEKAIQSVKEYLIELLEKEQWCEAERIGSVLKTLVSNPPLTPYGQQLQAMAQMSGLGGLK